MKHFRTTNPLAATAIELVAFYALLHLVRLGFDQVSWRFAGPMTLAVMLIGIGAYLRYCGVGLNSIGLVKLRWPKGVLLFVPQILLAFVLIGVTALGVSLTGEALNVPVFTAEQPDPLERWGDLPGNTSLFLFWIAILWFAGPAEELVFRGFVIPRLITVFGDRVWGLAISVVLPAVIFGLGHVYYQGWRGFFVTGAIGITLGILFLLYRRNIWPLMVAHAAFNSMVFTGVYLGADF